MKWLRGVTLMTNSTRKWSQEEINRNNEIEKTMVFSDFTPLNQGKSRKLVCTVNNFHPDYEKNAKIIENAPAMLDVLKVFERINDIWLPDKVSEEHIEEIKALHVARNEMLMIIERCDGN